MNLPLRLLGLVVQWLEQWTHNPLVAGSNPAGPTGDKAVRNRAAFFIPPVCYLRKGLRPAEVYSLLRRYRVQSNCSTRAIAPKCCPLP